MNDESNESDIGEPQTSLTGQSVIRCLLALLCSHLGAPYASARVTIRYLLDGSVEPRFAALSAISTAVGGVLAFRQLTAQPTGRKLLYGTTAVAL